MSPKRLILVFTICATASLARAQQRFYQFILVDLRTQDQCRLVEDSVRVHPGFESIRAEAYSDNFLAFSDLNTNYSIQDFQAWLAPLGYSIYCYREGITGVDPILRLSIEGCHDEPSIEERE